MNFDLGSTQFRINKRADRQNMLGPSYETKCPTDHCDCPVMSYYYNTMNWTFKQVTRYYDANKDGCIDFCEFRWFLKWAYKVHEWSEYVPFGSEISEESKESYHYQGPPTTT